MIFTTVGTQMPFDRMIRVVDEWATKRGRSDILAQVGPSAWKPKHVRWVEFMNPLDFRRRVEEADVVVAHAGMGSIITALELGKPILVMPRRCQFREHRNDHQVDTAQRLLEQHRVSVAFEPEELGTKLDQLDSLSAAKRVKPQASAELLDALRDFVWRGAPYPHARCGYDGVISIEWRDQQSEVKGFDRRLLRQLPPGFPFLRVVLEGTEKPPTRLQSISTGLLSRLVGLLDPVHTWRMNRNTVRISHSGVQEQTRISDEIALHALEAGIRSPLVYVRDPGAAALARLLPHSVVVENQKSLLSVLSGQGTERMLKPFTIRGVDSVQLDQLFRVHTATSQENEVPSESCSLR